MIFINLQFQHVLKMLGLNLDFSCLRMQAMNLTELYYKQPLFIRRSVANAEAPILWPPDVKR